MFETRLAPGLAPTKKTTFLHLHNSSTHTELPCLVPSVRPLSSPSSPFQCMILTVLWTQGPSI
ncbi:hypothetical protein TYRP_012809 [Tyrophagus putrescentiae]|nr:hypothetical protein TYRP_012809 [Tyrophagus putrescentiae]